MNAFGLSSNLPACLVKSVQNRKREKKKKEESFSYRLFHFRKFCAHGVVEISLAPKKSAGSPIIREAGGARNLPRDME
jgi:hypothetical protein